MKKMLLLIVPLFACVYVSCTKDYSASTTTTVPPVPPINLATIFSSMAVTPQTTTILAEKGGSFFGSNGARYIIPANILRTASGAAVTGSVQVETAEYIKRSDMIFSGMAPTSNGEPLISGGEFYINATQGGQKLRINSGDSYQVKLPQIKPASAGMQLFTSTGSLRTTTGLVPWIPTLDTTRHGIAYNGDTLTLSNDSMQMCNADHFMISPNYQNFTITAKATGQVIHDSLMAGFVLYDNYNGYWPLGIIGNLTNGVYTEEHVPNIPVHFVIVAIINNNLYAGILGATPSSGTNYNVTLSQTTSSQLQTQIDAL